MAPSRVFVFQLRVSGNNLTNVCKLVFKVSKDERNDVHFTEGNILGKQSEWQSHDISARSHLLEVM